MDLDTPQRLTLAREKAGYRTASAAAEAMGIRTSTYINHENGTRGVSRYADRYARFFRVNLDWLLTGRGDMKTKAPQSTLHINGYVTAGAHIIPLEEDKNAYLKMPWLDQNHWEGLIVQGDSQWPRFMSGEVILYDPEPLKPEELIGHYAVCRTLKDGRTMLKIIRKGTRVGTFTLESHNAPPLHDIDLMAAYKVVGLLTSLPGKPVSAVPDSSIKRHPL
jgi:hypothetical protein